MSTQLVKPSYFFTIENELLLILFRSHEKDGYNAERKKKNIYKYANLKRKLE